MPDINHHPVSRMSDQTEFWVRLASDSAGELTIVDHAPETGEFLGRQGKLRGTKLPEILVDVTPQTIPRRLREIVRNEGTAFFPQCRISTPTGERWFSLDCSFEATDRIMVTLARAEDCSPWCEMPEPILDRFPWCMQVFDCTGQSTAVNAAFTRLSGLSNDDLGEYNILYDPTYRREDLAGLVDRLFEGELVRFDTLAGHAAHEPLEPFARARRRLYPAWGIPIVGKSGQVDGAVMTYEDTGEEKSPADYLADERKFAAQIIETTEALVVSVDTSGRITLFNSKCEETTGWKKEEVLGTLIWETLIPARYADRVKSAMRGLVGGGTGRTRAYNPWLTKDGRERMVSWHNTYIRNPKGNLERITAVGIDITDQLRIERKLRESEENYRSVTESSLNGIFIYRDDRFIYCNARLEEILGLHRDMIIGQPVWKYAHPDDLDMIKDRAKRRQRGEADLPTHYSFRVLNSAGETRWLEMIVTTMDYQGRKAILGNVVDITEKKDAESERDALRRRLAQTQKMDALATLIGGIAHDFNNLLTGIMAGTSDVLSQTEPDDPRFRPLGDILQASRRAKDLISQLLTAGSSGPAAMAQLDLNDIIKEAIRFVGPTLVKNIELRLSLNDNPMLMMGDHNQLWQTVSNLCLNARDAMPDGGVLEIKTETGIKNGNETFTVVVSDTGKGIPAEIKDRIFEPFFTTKDRGLGIGLGLAVVYGAVKNHGGTIEVSDLPGGGTVFRIDFEPAVVAGPTEEKAIAYPDDRAVSRRILIVDDEDGVRHVVGRILSREGHIVQTAQDSTETMNIVAQAGGKLDLVILDLEMPGKSGAEIFAEIKRDQPDLKILLSSGQAPGPAAKRLLAKGAAGFLQKPYDLWELRRAVKSAISQA
ncbi:PAS domain S-box protein [Candidatus Zixiibacteriota bacterium]